MRKLVKAVTVVVEGVLFLWSVRKAKMSYIHWRLGTLYGSFERDTGQPRTIKELLDCLWRDRANITRFLLWRREMRR
jgi:hypothetical protein